MLTVRFANTFVPEKAYVFEVLLHEFLNCEYRIAPDQQSSYSISQPDGRQIIIEDHFFGKLSEEEGFLKPAHIPNTLDAIDHAFVQKTIPVIFGNGEIEISTQTVRIGADLVASVFYMLTRWEEVAISKRDLHGRFPGEEALSVQKGFIERPVVDEYARLLSKALIHLGYEHLPSAKFSDVVTFDIDQLRKYPYPLSGLKTLAGDILKRRSLTTAARTWNELWGIYHGRRDPYDTFEEIYTLAERLEFEFRLFFLMGGMLDPVRRAKVPPKTLKRTIKAALDRNVTIGLHPSYYAKSNSDILRSERDALESLAGQTLVHSRQHYLRIDIPKTWSQLDTLGFQVDSSMYYPGHPGFRTGTCHLYSAFDMVERKSLTLKIETVVFGQFTWQYYLAGIPQEEIADYYSGLRDRCKLANGRFVSLWHNSTIHDDSFPLTLALNLND